MGRASRRRAAAAKARQQQQVATPSFRSDAACEEPVDRRPLLTTEAWHGLEQLRVLHEERCLLDQQVHTLVGTLAATGVSWADIGRALGMSRQGARQRYSA